MSLILNFEESFMVKRIERKHAMTFTFLSGGTAHSLMSPAHSGCGVSASLAPKHGLPKRCVEGRTSQ